MAPPIQPAGHPNRKVREAILKDFAFGKSSTEIARERRMPKGNVDSIITRAGLSRGEKPSAPKRFSWETEDAAP